MALKLTTQQIEDTHQLVSSAKSIVITSHKSPDGDAVGSSLALLGLISKINKNVKVVLPDGADAYLHWMIGYQDIILFDIQKDLATSTIEGADLIFSLDYNNLSRTGSEMEAVLRKSDAKFILIDHHQQPENYSVVLYSDTSACSTCEMIYRFADMCGWMDHIDIPVAEAIYCGIMTDSGSFRFPSVTPETHYIVADLMSRGMNHARVHQEVYDSNLVDRMKLVGYAISEKLQVWEDCATAVVSLTQEELLRFNHRPGDTEGLVNQALSIRGIKMAVFLREGNNEIKMSFRSKGTFDVNVFARGSWNGGGHKNAAGGMTKETMNEALTRLEKEVKAIKNDILAS
jgi:bifunctional oligoribonuclease and PAP phosphatase NrnA